MREHRFSYFRFWRRSFKGLPTTIQIEGPRAEPRRLSTSRVRVAARKAINNTSRYRYLADRVLINDYRYTWRSSASHSTGRRFESSAYQWPSCVQGVSRTALSPFVRLFADFITLMLPNIPSITLDRSSSRFLILTRIDFS